jgi:tRNA pseudouridine13 synthase
MILKASKIEADLGIEVFVSKTSGIGGKIRVLKEDFIVEEVLTNGSKASVDFASSAELPSKRGRYLICLLVKKGWETISAIRKVAKQIGVQSNQISFAGLKDAQALTAQYISIGGLSPESLSKIDLKDVKVYPLGFSSEKISPKILFGNSFRIKVKSVKYSLSTTLRRVEKIMSELEDFGGIPNFFGHQRFGAARPVTHHVGYYLVKGRFEDAALLFLSQTSPYESPAIKEARRYVGETRDFKGALKLFPRRMVYERLMLLHLSKYSNDFLGAFRKLPREIRVIFVQAYQSYLFNRFLSERMKRSIPLHEAHIGDYVLALEENGLPTDMSEIVAGSNIAEIREKVRKRRMAVSIPLIGFKQGTSSGVQGEIEKEILEDEGVKPEDFRLEKMLEASAAGRLRTTLSPVLSLNIATREIPDIGEVNVDFSFTLHRGSYASIVLREFMKPRFPAKAGF